jgi:hypothetical protein
MAKSSRTREFSGKRPYPQIDWILATGFRHLLRDDGCRCRSI